MLFGCQRCCRSKGTRQQQQPSFHLLLLEAKTLFFFYLNYNFRCYSMYASLVTILFVLCVPIIRCPPFNVSIFLPTSSLKFLIFPNQTTPIADPFPPPNWKCSQLFADGRQADARQVNLNVVFFSFLHF